MSVNLAPGPFGVGGQFFDSNGNPLNGGFAYTYAAGTTAPQPTYTTSVGNIANSNPMQMTVDGRLQQEMWFTAGLAYKIIVTDSVGVVQFPYTMDNLRGINDVTIPGASEWQDSGQTPVFVNTTSFTLTGDQTQIFDAGRRIRVQETAGTLYGFILSSSYSPGTTLTTVNVAMDSGGVLDSGLSAVAYGILNSVNVSTPKFIQANSPVTITYDTQGRPVVGVTLPPQIPISIRQTVLSGPVDSNGLPNFGGSTGGITVTVSGTLIATAANGYNANGNVDLSASITNPSWTGLNTNGTMYLYMDLIAGVWTPGSTTLAPVYTFGATPSTTNGQSTFQIQEMQMFVGNGSTAPQTSRVFVGEVTISGNVVTAITWYALKGQYIGPFTATLPSAGTATIANHNMGVADVDSIFEMENTTPDGNYSVGDRVRNVSLYANDASARANLSLISTAKTLTFIVNSSTVITTINKTTFGSFLTTAANWKWRIIVYRTWGKA